VTWLETNPQQDSSITDICPLVGNANIPARNYQSNENVRLMAQQFGAASHFLYLPALPDNQEEKRLLCSTEVYHQIEQQWEQIDTALVNIGNYPSSPDFASLVRYGDLLQKQHACGRMLIYYFNEDGTVIQSDQDFAIQIPLDLLRKCPNIIGVCSANTSEKALCGVQCADAYCRPVFSCAGIIRQISYICYARNMIYSERHCYSDKLHIFNRMYSVYMVKFCLCY